MKKMIATLALAGFLAGVTPAHAAMESYSDEGTFASWFASAAAEMRISGIMTGFADQSFRPAQTVTRAELAVIIQRFAKFAGIDLTPGDRVCTLDFRYGLTVHLYDQNGQPLEGVIMRYLQRGAQDDGDFEGGEGGTYIGIGEGNGLYDVEATKEGYMPLRESITLQHDGCHVAPQTWTRIMPKVQ